MLQAIKALLLKLPQNIAIFCGKRKNMTSKTIVESVRARIEEHDQGWCFTPKHFLDLESDTGVRSTLSRLEKMKVIRRLAQGLYDYPRQHPVLGLLPPKPEEVIKAIAEKNGIRTQAAGAYAANMMGLSEQVPGQIIFLTNGPSKKLKIGKQEIVLRTTTEKNMYAADSDVGLVIQAYKNLGKDNIDETVIAKTKKFLSSTNQETLIHYLKYAPQWIRTLILTMMGIKK